MSSLIPIIVIVGPTASGKTELSLRLAKQYNGEIISADSRQMYRGMDVGTAKEKGEWIPYEGGNAYMVRGIPHHLMDFLDPNETFTLAQYKKEVKKKIEEIYARGKMPFLVGGTGLYVQAVIDNLTIPRVKPNETLRKELSEKSEEELWELLQKTDPVSAERIDKKNIRRVIRALEVAMITGRSFFEQQKKGKPFVRPLFIGVERSREELYDRINARVEQQIEQGMVEETQTLLDKGYDFHLPAMSGIGYAHLADYLGKRITLEEAKELIKRDTRRYAKRQLTWFRRDKRIQWVKNVEDAEKAVKTFLKV